MMLNNRETYLLALGLSKGNKQQAKALRDMVGNKTAYQAAIDYDVSRATIQRQIKVIKQIIKDDE